MAAAGRGGSGGETRHRRIETFQIKFPVKCPEIRSAEIAFSAFSAPDFFVKIFSPGDLFFGADFARFYPFQAGQK
jgi:hypothetical protein